MSARGMSRYGLEMTNGLRDWLLGVPHIVTVAC
jgi:hypothetical protein